MTVSDAKYYLTRDYDSGKPFVLYRFFQDNAKLPEELSAFHDWQADSDIRLLRM
jgi:hypothetical protein